MKNRLLIAIFVGLVLVGLGVALLGLDQRDPKDLSYWMRAAGDKDWSAEATQNRPEAQFYHGLTLIRSNMVTMIDRVPGFSSLPLVGKRAFQKTSYGIDNDISQERLTEAYRWIKKSAEQGYAPAIEAEKLFIGKIAVTNKSTQTNWLR